MNYYDEIKNELLNNEINKKVKNYSINKSDLKSNYNVGKLLREAGSKYGEGIIKDYSRRLTIELGKGYTQSRLRYYRRFYDVFEKCPTLSDALSYSHYCEIIWLDIAEIKYYIEIALKNNLTVRQLRTKVKSNEYKRLSEETRDKIIKENKIEVKDLIPNPIMIRNKNNLEIANEKILKKLILEDIDNFLLELGNNFCYIGNEYKIKIGNRYNYIDLLLYNIEFNCYVVLELKVTELKKEHIGQIEVYMNCIDSTLKKFNQNKSIGIIICKKDNKYIIGYRSDERIIAREYELI